MDLIRPTISWEALVISTTPYKVDVPSGSIVDDVDYIVENIDGSYITYNGTDYYDDDTFTGVYGITDYTESGSSNVYNNYQYITKLQAVNPNDIGYEQLAVGYFIVDYIGYIYEILEVNYGGDSMTVKVRDLIKDPNGYGIYQGRNCYVYESLTKAATVAQAKLNRLDESAEDFIRSLGIEEDDFLTFINAGMLNIPSFTVEVDTTITIGSGNAALFDNDNYEGFLNRYIISSDNFTLTDELLQYIVVDYNSGSPQYDLIDDFTLINGSSIVLVYSIFKKGGDINYVNWGETGYGLSNKSFNRTLGTKNIIIEEGLKIFNDGGMGFTVSSGVVWIGNERKVLNELSSAELNTTYRWTHEASVWTELNVTEYNSLTYQGDIYTTALTDGQYGINWIYRSIDDSDEIRILLGTDSYNTVWEADKAQPPTDLPNTAHIYPDIITNHSVLVGKIIIKKGDSQPTAIHSISDISFNKSTNIHSELTGLLDDDHTQYALLDGRDGDILKIDEINEFNTGVGVTIEGVNLINNGAIAGSSWIPTIDQNFTTKLYVDNLAKVITYDASNLNVVVSDGYTGTYQDLADLNTNIVQVEETVGTPGFDIRVTYNGVDSFNNILIYQYYHGGSNHSIHVELYDPNTTLWDEVYEFTDEGGFVLLNIPIINGANYISGTNDVIVRIYHTDSGNATHYIELDYMAIRKTPDIGGGGGVTHHSSLTGLSHDDHLQYALLDGRLGDILKIDNLLEYTTDAGITAESILLKDGGITLGTGATVDTIETTLTDDDTHLPTSGAVFDAISGISTLTSPLTTKGDIWVYSTLDTRLPIGTDGQILSADSTEATGLKWIDNTSGGYWTQTGSDIYYNTGNVGIGTTSPNEKLEVNGNIRLPNTKLFLRNDSALINNAPTYGIGLSNIASSSSYFMQFGDFYGINFVTGGNSSLTIDRFSNVGIGNTAPTGKLSIFTQTSDFAQFDFTESSTSGYKTTFHMDDTGLDIGHNSGSRALNLKTGDTDRLTILGNGNVGIGTTSPSYTLDVSGTGRFTGALTAASFIKSGGTSSQFLKADGSVDELRNQVSVTSDSTPNPTGNYNENEYYLTALAANATFSAPSGTASNGNTLLIRIEDNGTSRTLSWNSIYREIGVALPSITNIGKIVYIGCIYNSTDSKWDVVSVVEEA